MHHYPGCLIIDLGTFPFTLVPFKLVEQKMARFRLVRSVMCGVLRLSPQPPKRRRIVPQPQVPAETSGRLQLRQAELPTTARAALHSYQRQTSSGCETIPYPGPSKRLPSKSSHEKMEQSFSPATG